ncbi:MAG: malectin domain-containing carbohydrate-binding protein [Elusimicrobiota bacterium]
MNRRARGLILALAAASPWGLAAAAGREGNSNPPPFTIVRARGPRFKIELAARELRRYLYARTGTLAKITPALPGNGDALLLAAKNDPILKTAWIAGRQADLDGLGPEQYLIRTVGTKSGRVTVIVGGDDQGVLYGVYRYCERLGVRFYLHGDVIPDRRLKGPLPIVDEAGKPLFSIRGILPFHDFPEGPDWWSRDDYLGIVSQLSKLRMNFIGMHCYPPGGPHAEPLVWIGPPEDQHAGGEVSSSYPALWANTRRDGDWGYKPMATSEFRGGASQLFAEDDYSQEIMTGLLPQPRTSESQNILFNKAGALLHDAFSLARRLGVKTAVGLETPLVVPQEVQARLKALGKAPGDPGTARELYRGIFSRILAAHPLDYFWLWTPENWTWAENKPEEFAAAARDIRSAQAALDALGNPFTLATAGWVLGPVGDRSALDSILPKTSPMSAINREVGGDLIESGFGGLIGRPKWAVPWMENDPHLTLPQLWAGRMRYDAADARRLGCTGLLGIHWRTRIMAPNVSALAAAGWDQSYVSGEWRLPLIPRGKGPLGGSEVFTDHPVAGTSESFVFQSMREDTDGYDLDMPNGLYTVTLKFNEPHFAETGKRLFGISLQGRTVEERLDIFARAGRNRALEISYPDVRVVDGEVRIAFQRIAGLPCVSAVVISGRTEAGSSLIRKINSGGDVVAGYERDGANDKPGTVERGRTMPLGDFYEDFARANFGDSVAAPAGRLFERLDGWNFPQPATWNNGPGFIAPVHLDPHAFDFVQEMSALRERVSGAGNLERFDYWLNTFRYMRALSETGALRADLDEKMAETLDAPTAAQGKSSAQEALALRVLLARAWERMMSDLTAAASSPGELGTIANLEQHTRADREFLTRYDRELERILARPLPAESLPGGAYEGPARIVVPTVRGEAAPGERLELRIMAIDAQPVVRVDLHWRRLGEKPYHIVPASLLGRAVYRASLPSGEDDVEYFVSAETRSGRELRWPAGAPGLGQTVVTLPAENGGAGL